MCIKRDLEKEERCSCRELKKDRRGGRMRGGRVSEAHHWEAYLGNNDVMELDLESI